MTHTEEMYFASTGFEHYYQNRRRVKILKTLERIGGSNLLDVGCGDGYYLDQAKNMGYVVAGVDTEPSNHPYVFQGCAEELPFADKSFDVVMCNRTLEYVDHPGLVVAELVRVSRKHIIITVPLGTKPYTHGWSHAGLTAHPFTIRGITKPFPSAKVQVLCPVSKFFGTPLPILDTLTEPLIRYGMDIFVWAKI